MLDSKALPLFVFVCVSVWVSDLAREDFAAGKGIVSIVVAGEMPMYKGFSE